MQLFDEGKDRGWGHIHYKIEYETARNEKNEEEVGVRFKIKWEIDNYYWFAYNIYADIYVEENNYGRQIKANSPQTGKGEITTEWFWFDKGYENNNINSCKIVIKSTNGGNIPFDTGDYRIIYAPQGYIPSIISNDIDFNIGNDLKISIEDITNIKYDYKLYLDIVNENNKWQNIASININKKEYIWNLSALKEDLFNLLPNRNQAKIRIKLETRYSGNLIGATIKEGLCKVVDSNPDIPEFYLIYQGDWLSKSSISHIRNGFSPYNNIYNIYVKIKKISSIVGKNGATLKKYIFKGGTYVKEINIEQLEEIMLFGGNGLDNNYQYEQVNVKTEEDGEDTYNSFYSLTVVDSRGNTATKKYDCTVDYFIIPYFTEATLTRKDSITNEVHLKASGRFLHGYENAKVSIKYVSNYAEGSDLDLEHEIPSEFIEMSNDGNFVINDYILEFDRKKFDVEKDYIVEFMLWVSPMPEYEANHQQVFLQKGVPYEYDQKSNKSKGIGKKPNISLPNYSLDIAGDLNVDGTIRNGEKTLSSRSILWENSNPSAEMKADTVIKLNSNDYDIIEWFYIYSNATSNLKVQSSSSCMKGCNVMLTNIGYGTGNTIRRILDYVTDTEYKARIGKNNNDDSGGHAIPVKAIGIKY